MAADHRSIVPSIAGVPWWGAVLIAATATMVGWVIDAGHKDLSHVFAGCYIAGCVAAMLAVRQSGVFTAVIQPPLLLFGTVPAAYWMFHDRKVGNLKDLLINCGYPLIERFPLMLGTAGGVLLIGLIRWYFGMSHRSVATAGTEDTAAAVERPSAIRTIATKLRSLFSADPDLESDDAATADPQRAPAVNHARRSSARTGRATRSSRSTERASRTRSRHARPSPDDVQEQGLERPRRPARRAQPRGYEAGAGDPSPSPRPRRRPRPPADQDLRAQREPRRDPQARRNPYERPTPRTSRFDPYDRYERPPEPPSRHSGPYEGYDSYDSYDPYGSSEQPRRRATPTGSNGSNRTHHPISQVRYRGETSRDQLREPPEADRRRRSRAPRPPAGSWEYDA